MATLREPSEAAWKRSGEIGARILTNLAIRRAEAAARDRASHAETKAVARPQTA